MTDTEECGFSYDHTETLIDTVDGVSVYVCDVCGAEWEEEDPE